MSLSHIIHISFTYYWVHKFLGLVHKLANFRDLPVAVLTKRRPKGRTSTSSRLNLGENKYQACRSYHGQEETAAWSNWSPHRLRSCLFCEGRISVLKRWFKTPIQNALHGGTVHASLEKKTISWACTAHCSRLLFELKWTGKAFIWRHLNVVIMILRSCFHQNQRFALTTIVNAHFWAFWISVLKRRLFENKHGRNSVLL